MSQQSPSAGPLRINWIEIRVITISSTFYPSIPSVYIRIHRYSLNTNMMHVEIIARRNKIRSGFGCSELMKHWFGLIKYSAGRLENLTHYSWP